MNRYHFLRIFQLITAWACLLAAPLWAAGKVYLVLGSDTAIWDGMSVNRYANYYNPALYTDLSRNTYGVMDPAFRNPMVDSYGTPMKLTWWMMCGSIYRPGNNTNVPYPNIMTMYLMKKYHGDRIAQYGDELTLHYHTFKWTDYDRDGMYFWNQTLTFEECREDFDFTLAQLLIEEEVFPVSFRSGWHYMDNGWQAYLDKLLPYSLHNDWPNDRIDTTEPLDNTFHWAQAPEAFVPYRPSPSNYQLPGEGPGWNVRSTHLNRARYLDLMDTLFANAYNGEDQLACIWGHLPESDFLTNLQIIDSLAHRMAGKYPGVQFRYATAIEAFQHWREQIDSIPPVLSIDQTVSGEDVFFQISSDEPIFQEQPFVAIKNIYEDFQVIPCQPLGPRQWITSQPVKQSLLARAAVAVSDTMGNQTLSFIDNRPPDRYVDNEDPGYEEVRGQWASRSGDFWGTDHRYANIAAGDSAMARWHFTPTAGGMINIEIRIPLMENPAENLSFRVVADGATLAEVQPNTPPIPGVWTYIATVDLDAGSSAYLEMTARSAMANRVAVADVVKFSALVRDRDIHPATDILNFGEIVVSDTARVLHSISNRGIETLTLNGVTAVNGRAGVINHFPLAIPPMGSVDLDAYFFSDHTGDFRDTLTISSDDPFKPQLMIPVTADVQTFFRIIDNEDTVSYAEQGSWFYSNAQANGPTSRYAPLNQSPGASATFTTTIEKTGLYEIMFIVPSTVNAADKARYRIFGNGIQRGAYLINQNEGSGDWVPIDRLGFAAGVTLTVSVSDDGNSSAGLVLRADALKLAIVEDPNAIDDPDALPAQFAFLPNYPNPFNATTTFRYRLPRAARVRLHIYNTLGQRVATLVDAPQQPGSYTLRWQAETTASGIYFAHFQAGPFLRTRKLMLIK